MNYYQLKDEIKRIEAEIKWTEHRLLEPEKSIREALNLKKIELSEQVENLTKKIKEFESNPDNLEAMKLDLTDTNKLITINKI